MSLPGENPELDAELLERVARELARMARSGERATYAELVERLAIAPPRQIRKLVLCLEQLMRMHHARGEPLQAALVASKIRDGLPAPGFFALARELGCYQGPEGGPLARAWHEAELERVRAQARGG